LWRKLTTEPLPDILRLPARLPRPAEPAAAGNPPGLRRVTLPDGAMAWEPIPCYRSLPAQPPPEAPRPPEPGRRQRDYLWIGRLFTR
jgi:hypothetical protein